MRPLLPLLVAICAMTSLAGCAGDRHGASAPPLENFDPSQVRMLPDNPYQSAPVKAAVPASPS